MGQGTQVKSARNEQLINDYQETNSDGTRKYTVTQLVQKYDISPARIYTILKSYNVVIDRPKNNIGKFNDSRKS